MSESIRSKRPLGETTTTRLFLTDEDEIQVVQADIDEIDVVAYRRSERLPFWQRLGIDPTDDDPMATVYDTLQTASTWTATAGYNFKSRIPYSGDFKPLGGSSVRIEFVFHLISGDPIVVTHWATYEDTLSISDGTVTL